MLALLIPGVHMGGGDGVVAQPPAPQTGGVRESKRWPLNYDSLDLEKWRKSRRKLESKIEEVQKQIQKKRDLTETVSLERKLRLVTQIQKLNERLVWLLGELDMLKKAMDEAEEEAEIIAVYAAYRRLH